MNRQAVARFLFFAACLQFAAAPLQAQDEASKIQIKAPPGWRPETIQLPPAFAKDMTWQGVEQLRFAPGMFKEKEKDFFSYFMLFDLQGKQPTDRKQLASELKSYYAGLASSVLKSRGKEVADFKVVVETMDKPLMIKGDGESETTWNRARIKWVEPFVTAKPQTLELRWRTLPAGPKRSVLVLLASPGKEKGVWETLHKIADSVKTGE